MKRREFLQHTIGLAGLGAGVRPRLNAAAATPVRKAAVIGHTGRGNYGHGLDVLFAGRPGIELVAVADPDAAALAKARERTGARRVYADYREMLERERPELVSVAPRWTDQHHAMVRAALAVGAHVYCEKPFTRTLAEADDLLRQADGAGRRIAVAHQTRLVPGTLQIKRRLDDGLIGDLREIRVHGKQDRRGGGEDMVVLGTHQFDLVRFFAGDPQSCRARIFQDGREIGPADVRAPTEDIGPVVGDDVDATFALKSGVIVRYTSRAGRAAADGPMGMELVGSRGSVRFLNDFSPKVFLREGDQWRPLDLNPAAKAFPAAEAVNVANGRVVDDWLAAIAEGREPVCSGRAAMKSLEMIHAVFAAGLSRSQVEFPLKNRAHPLAV